MTPTDMDALTRAIAACRAADPARSAQIDAMLSYRPWAEVGTFAAASAQRHSLHLKPWQSPPCRSDPEDLYKPIGDPRGERESAELLRRLLDIGLSRYEPDPLQAIAQAEKRLGSDDRLIWC